MHVLVGERIIDILPVPPRPYQARLTQHPQLMRYRRLAHPERERNIHHAHLLDVQHVQYLYARAVAEDLEQLLELIQRILVRKRVGETDLIDIDEVVVSVGVSPNPLIPNSIKGLEVSKWGTIVVNQETMQSDIPDLFAGGDIVRGGATVILAMGDGRRAAAAMDEYIKSQA